MEQKWRSTSNTVFGYNRPFPTVVARSVSVHSPYIARAAREYRPRAHCGVYDETTHCTALITSRMLQIQDETDRRVGRMEKANTTNLSPPLAPQTAPKINQREIQFNPT